MTSRRGPRGGTSWGRPAVMGLALAALTACTLEERPDRPAEEDAPEEPDGEVAQELVADEAAATTVDSVRAVAAAFRDAVDLGDLSSALQLLDGEAVVFDRVGGDPPEGASTGEVLLREIRLRREGLTLDQVSSDLRVHEGAAVEVTRSEASWEGDGARDGLRGPVLETVVLVRTEDGWRVGHLHRSAAPGDG